MGKGQEAQTYRFDPLAPEGKQVTEVKESGLAGSFAGQKEEASVLSKAAYLGNQDMVSKKEQQDLRKQEQSISEVSEPQVQAAPQTTVPSVESVTTAPQVQSSQQIPSKETSEQLEQKQKENKEKTDKLFDEIKQQLIETRKLVISTKTVTKQSGTNPQDKPKFASVEEKDKYDEEVQNAKDVMQYGGTSFTKKFAYGFKAGILGEKFAKKSAIKNANKDEREKAFRLLNPDKVKPAGETTSPPPLPNAEAKPTENSTVPNMETSQSTQQTSSPELEKKVDQVIQSTKDIPTVKDGVERIEKRVSPRDVTVGKGDDAQTYKFDPLAPQGKQVTEATEAGLAGKFAGNKEEASVLSKAAYFGNQDLVAKKEQEDARKPQEVSEAPETSSNIVQPTDLSVPSSSLISASTTTIPSIENTESNTEDAQAANIVAVQKEKAESEKEDREQVIGKLNEIEKKIDKLLSKEDEDGGGGLSFGKRGLGKAARALGKAGRAIGRGAASVGRGALTAARAAGPALGRIATTAARFAGPAAAVAGAGYTGYKVGQAIDSGVEKLTGKSLSDRTASGIGAITGQNSEAADAVRAGELTFAETKKKKNEQLKGTGYELVAPGKYKGPDGQIISQNQLPPQVQSMTKPGAIPNAQGVVQGKIQRPGTTQETKPTAVPTTATAAPTTPAPAIAEAQQPETNSEQETSTTQPQPKSEIPAVTPTAAPVMSAVSSESRDKRQEEKITKLTSENAVLKSQQTTAIKRAAKVPRANPTPPPQQKKEKREDTTVIQIRNLEQSVATYTASIFDHPVVHPGIYKM